MGFKKIVLTDDPNLDVNLVGDSETLIISLNFHATHELKLRGWENVRDISEYQLCVFSSYEELYEYYAPLIRVQFQRKESNQKSILLFEAFLPTILIELMPALYLQDMVDHVMKIESPVIFSFVITDSKLSSFLSMPLKKFSSPV